MGYSWFYLVCVYPSDIEEVRNFIRVQSRETPKRYITHPDYEDGEEKVEDGYRAFHYIIRPVQQEFAVLWCEVQIKSVLADAWEWAEKARECLLKLKQSVDRMEEGDDKERMLIRAKDVEGLVFICSAKDAATIDRGVSLCRSAYENSKDDKNAAKLYFEVHSDLAKRRKELLLKGST